MGKSKVQVIWSLSASNCGLEKQGNGRGWEIQREKEYCVSELGSPAPPLEVLALEGILTNRSKAEVAGARRS